MQEMLDDLLQYLRGIWLQRRYVVLLSWLICPIGWGVVSMMPDKYESEARVYADTRSLLQPLLKGVAVQSDPYRDVKIIVQTLLNRNNMERIARESDMDIHLGTQTQGDYEQMLLDLKGDISIRSAGRENLYTIKYASNSPLVAKNVVQGVLDVFVESTLGEKRQESDVAQKFLEQQIAEYEKRLELDELKLADFKRKHGGAMPGSEHNYYAQLNANREQLEAAELELREAETSLLSAKAQLRGELDTAQPQPNTLYDERISQLQTRLDDLLLRYTDAHPDVIETRRRIDDIIAQRQAMFERGGNKSSLANNPLYADLIMQVNSMENNVASLRVRVQRYQSRVNEIKQILQTIPEVEAELTGLQRSYSITKSKYEELLTRRESALIASSANLSADEIKFDVLDPPKVPMHPSGPKRIIYLILVTFAGFAAGIGLSFLISQITPIVSTARQLTMASGLPVFGVVSATDTSGLAAWERRKTRFFVASNVLLIAGFCCVVTINAVPELRMLILRQGATIVRGLGIL